MPNGHGGIPRYGSPVLLLLVIAYLAALRATGGGAWTGYAALLAALLLGWRLAWHLWLYDLTEYGGAYADPEEMRAARRRYYLTAAVLAPAGAGLAGLLWALAL